MNKSIESIDRKIGELTGKMTLVAKLRKPGCAEGKDSGFALVAACNTVKSALPNGDSFLPGFVRAESSPLALHSWTERHRETASFGVLVPTA